MYGIPQDISESCIVQWSIFDKRYSVHHVYEYAAASWISKNLSKTFQNLRARDSRHIPQANLLSPRWRFVLSMITRFTYSCFCFTVRPVHFHLFIWSYWNALDHRVISMRVSVRDIRLIHVSVLWKYPKIVRSLMDSRSVSWLRNEIRNFLLRAGILHDERVLEIDTQDVFVFRIFFRALLRPRILYLYTNFLIDILIYLKFLIVIRSVDFRERTGKRIVQSWPTWDRFFFLTFPLYWDPDLPSSIRGCQIYFIWYFTTGYSAGIRNVSNNIFHIY